MAKDGNCSLEFFPPTTPYPHWQASILSTARSLTAPVDPLATPPWPLLKQLQRQDKMWRPI